MGKFGRRSGRAGRNAPCWCGSGLKYKYCHLNRNSEEPLPPGQLLAETRQYFTRKKMCLHPDAPALCGKIVQAHTLQRSGIIRSVAASDNHVLSFHPLQLGTDDSPEIHRVGSRQASTFLGFCEHHDGILFAEIEQQPFIGSRRQVLLIGYRALCHELYQKLAATDAEPMLRDHLDRGAPPAHQALIQDMLNAMSAGRRLGLAELFSLKRFYDGALDGNDPGLMHHVILWFRGAPCLASTGAVHVDFDLNGVRLQNLGTAPSPAHSLTFGVVSTTDGCAVAAIWPATFHCCDRFIDSLMGQKEADVPSVLAEFFFAYVENTYFSEAWWIGLPEPSKKRLAELAAVVIQYGSPFYYSGLKHMELDLIQTNLETN